MAAASILQLTVRLPPRETATIRFQLPPWRHRDPKGLQSFSIPGFPADVDRRLHLRHRHLDADAGAGLADLENQPLHVPAVLGPNPAGDSDLSPLAGGRCFCRPRRTPPLAHVFPMPADVVRAGADLPGGLPRGEGLALSDLLLRGGFRAGVRRAGLYGA